MDAEDQPKTPQTLSDEHIEEIVVTTLEADEKGSIRVRIRRFWVHVRIIFTNVRTSAIRERKETVIAARILRDHLKGKEITEEEKRFLREQSIDLARILPIVAVQAIPAPVPVTPLLIALGKKIGVNVLPTEQEVPENRRKKPPKDPDQRFESEGSE